MLGQIYLSRFLVENALEETEFYSSYEVRDIINKRRNLLFLYSSSARPPLDLSSFAYRLFRFRCALPGKIPDCRMGIDDGNLYVLAEIEEGARSLDPLPGEGEKLHFLKMMLQDLGVLRTDELSFFNLSPQTVWRDSGGEPLYLPPAFLHFAGLLEDNGLVAPEAFQGPQWHPAADAYSFFSFLELFFDRDSNWASALESDLRELRQEDPDRRPSLAAALGGTELSAAAREHDGAAVAGLPSEAIQEIEKAVAAFIDGESVLVSIESDRPGSLAAWRCDLEGLVRTRAGDSLGPTRFVWSGEAESGRARTRLLVLDEFERPSITADPVWPMLASGVDEERLLVLLDKTSLSKDPARDEKVEEILASSLLPRRIDIRLPSFSTMTESPAIEFADREQPFLEILALLDEPVSLSFLISLLQIDEEEFFHFVKQFDRRGLLQWNLAESGSGEWGLQISLVDIAWKEELLAQIEPSRSRELHLLYVHLLDQQSRGQDLAFLLARVNHLARAEQWPRVAKEGIDLFRQAEQGRHQLLAWSMARRLLEPSAAAEVAVPDCRDLYLYLADQNLGQGDLNRAESQLHQGLVSLSGNKNFLSDLMADPPIRPKLNTGNEAAALAAVSSLLRKLADIYEMRGEFSLAERGLSRLLDAFNESYSAYERGLLYNDIAWYLYRMGRHETAVERCEIALRLFDSQNHFIELGQTYNTLGAARWALNHWQEAETYYKQSLSLREKAGDEIRVASSLNNLGNLYRLLGQFPQAIDYFNRSMAIKKRLRNYPGYIISLYNVALINFEMNDLKASRSQCQECLALNEQVGNVQLEAEIKGLLGEVSLVEGRLDEALGHLDEAIGVCREIEAQTELVTMYRRLMAVHLQRGDKTAAEQAARDGVKLAQEVGSRFEEAQIYSLQADLFLSQKETEEAVAKLESAADILTVLDKYEWLARVYSRLGLILLDDGFEVRAREYQRLATDIIERRQVTGLVPEWNTLQVRLQNRLGQFAENLSGDEGMKLATMYQFLNLLSSAAEARDVLEMSMDLLGSALPFQRAAAYLHEALEAYPEAGILLSPRGEFGDEAELLDLMKTFLSSPGFRDRNSEGLCRIFVPLFVDGRNLGVLFIERGGALCDDAERDFLNAFARILSLRLLEGTAGSAKATRTIPGGEARSSQAPTLIGRGRSMQRVFSLVDQVSQNDATVLITGESGTGKEEIAKLIHFRSPRSAKPFVPVNCASIPEALLESILFGHERGAFTGASHRHIGFFEEAAGGTILLDEIGEMSQEMQAKLLRVLQDKRFTRIGGTQSIHSDVRILAATNRDLTDEVKSQRFREDLFYRINVVAVPLAPLREKREDIPLLVDHFLEQTCGRYGIAPKRLSDEVLQIMLKHQWPGNIRQLQNVIQNCVILSRSELVQKQDLPDDFLMASREDIPRRSLAELAEIIVHSGAFTEDEPLESLLLPSLAHHLVAKTGSKTEAARLLGISKPTLYRRLKQYRGETVQ